MKISFLPARSISIALAVPLSILLASLPVAATSPPIEPSVRDLTERVVTGVATLAEEHGVRTSSFDHPLDRSAFLLAILVASPTVRDAGYPSLDRMRQLQALVREVQSADRSRLTLPEDQTRELLERSVALLDILRLATTFEPQPSHLDATCEEAAVIGKGVHVESTTFAANNGSASCGASATSPDRWFRFTAPESEIVVFEVIAANFDTVLSLHSGCPGTEANELACNDDAVDSRSRIERAMTAGDEVWIRVSGFAGAAGIFTLQVSGKTRIIGFVTSANDGSPLPATVELYSSTGTRVATTSTDSTGFYRLAVSPGSYFVATRSAFVDEVYDDRLCETSCTVTEGDLIDVTLNQEVRADFALDSLGGISGTVTSEVGDPVEGGVVVISPTSRFIDSGSIQPDGSFRVLGLPPEGYQVQTETNHADEKWDDRPCPDSGSCGPIFGEVVGVVQDQITPDIDFALGPRGSIRGTVTDADTGLPLEGIQLLLSTSPFFFDDSTTTAADGSYAFIDLDAGEYQVSTSDDRYLPEFWDDVPCNRGCSGAPGDPITVTSGQATTGIDFALDVESVLSGSVLDASSGLPLTRARISVFDESGELIASDSPNFSGVWEIDRLRPQTYRVSASESDYVLQLYDGIDCPATGCDPLAGTAIPLGAAEERTGVDFHLTPNAILQGTVVHGDDGSPLSARIQVFRKSGILEIDRSTGSDGIYELGGLPTGTYFVRAVRPGFFRRIYDGQDCMGTCDPTTGTPVTLTDGVVTSGVDFALEPLPSLSGSVIQQGTGEGLAGVQIQVLDTTGNPLQTLFTSTATDAFGRFTLTPEFSGDVKLRTQDTSFDDELFEEVPCQETCDFNAGRSLSLNPGVQLDKLLFTLTGCASPTDRTLQFFVFQTSTVIEACRAITTGEDVIIDGGTAVTFRAGQRIILGSGFAVLSGGSFTAEIVPELTSVP